MLSAINNLNNNVILNENTPPTISDGVKASFNFGSDKVSSILTIMKDSITSTEAYDVANRQLQNYIEPIKEQVLATKEALLPEKGSPNIPQKTGGLFFKKITTIFNDAKKNNNGSTLRAILSVIITPIKIAYTFIKTTLTNYIKFAKTKSFAGIPLSSWMIWGVCSAFLIISIYKFIEHRRNKKTNESFNITPYLMTYITTNLNEDDISNNSNKLRETKTNKLYGSAYDKAEKLNSNSKIFSNENISFMKNTMRYVVQLSIGTLISQYIAKSINPRTPNISTTK